MNSNREEEAEQKDKFECQECGMMVSPNEYHDLECCRRYKLSVKLASLSKFQERLKNE